MTSSLELRRSHDRRDVGRVEEIQKFMTVSRTSRLVWVSATLYGDGVRRRCATRCPRPLVDLLATQCPRLRRLSGGAAALKLVLGSPCSLSCAQLPGVAPLSYAQLLNVGCVKRGVLVGLV